MPQSAVWGGQIFSSGMLEASERVAFRFTVIARGRSQLKAAHTEAKCEIHAVSPKSGVCRVSPHTPNAEYAESLYVRKYDFGWIPLVGYLDGCGYGTSLRMIERRHRKLLPGDPSIPMQSMAHECCFETQAVPLDCLPCPACMTCMLCSISRTTRMENVTLCKQWLKNPVPKSDAG